MSYKLFIDTSDSEKITVSLKIDSKEFKKMQEMGVRKSQVVLTLIEELLKENHLKLHDLQQIEVHTGPGSFTGLRVGCAVANALSYTLHIPVNNKPLGKIIEPKY